MQQGMVSKESGNCTVQSQIGWVYPKNMRAAEH